MATLEQQRAAFALERVELVRDDERRNNAKYKTQLLKLPARLHNNGLGQTAAYLLAQKNGSPEKQVYDWLETWLCSDDRHVYPAGTQLIKCITGNAEGLQAADVEPRYRRASAETRALAVWLKRFAEAFLEGDAE
jgi:CRISPR-associated protein Cmr5